ncbi:MAG: site-2 protease family protein, partial [Bacteroidota bacterium]|nr:site-2 protease family protein [Bacteroidota bacterium]
LKGGLENFIALRYTFSVDSVLPGSNAEKAGLKSNDRILAVNDSPTIYASEFTEALSRNKSREIKLDVERVVQGQKTLVEFPAQVNENGSLGFILNNDLKRETEYFGFFEAMVVGANKAWRAVSETVKGLWRIITNDIPARESVSSFIGIANAYGGSWDWNSFWRLTALLSMVLAFMNLLPIPALDGGHVVFLLIEMLRGKPVSIRVLEIAQMVGMVLLFALMGFALYNDFAKFVF